MKKGKVIMIRRNNNKQINLKIKLNFEKFYFK